MKYLVLFDYNNSPEHQAFPTKEEAIVFIMQLTKSPHYTTIVLSEVLAIYKKDLAEATIETDKKIMARNNLIVETVMPE